MGKVVNKSFNQIRKSISIKSAKLAKFIKNNNFELSEHKGNHTKKQYEAYGKLGYLCESLLEEFDNIDEVEIPLKYDWREEI